MRDYCDNMVYRNGQLERIYTPEGYVMVQNQDLRFSRYIYQIRDHQGNVRGEAMSEMLPNNIGLRPCQSRYSTDYYPFGLEMVSKTGQTIPSPAPPELYSGNELERTDLQLYNFHHRLFDQQLGRFTTQDPLATLNYSVSPYAYCDNNPINFIDPLGLQGIANGEGNPYPLPEVEVVGYRKRSGSGWAGSMGSSYSDWHGNPFFGDGTPIYRGETQEEREQRQMREQGIVEGDKSVADIIGTVNDAGSFSLEVAGTQLDKSVIFLKGMQQESDALNLGLKYNSEISKLSKLSKYAKVGGWVSFGLSTGVTEYQYRTGEINGFQRGAENITNVISLIPVYGTAWSVGWELGKDYGPSKWYGTDDTKWFK